MARKDEANRMTAETAKASKPGKDVKTKVAKAKTPAKTQKKGMAQKKAAQSKAEVTFKLQAPQAAQVFVAGCFNEWDPTANPLERDNKGTWSCTLAVDLGEHEYRFLVDGVWWDDPTNMSRRWNEFGTQNCLLML
jgi:1,4-alpha-glucan branching enzyme